MSTFWKALVGALLVVPLAAYVVGTLATSSADDGDRDRPVIIGEPTDSTPASPSDDDDGEGRRDDVPETAPNRPDGGDDDGDDGGDDDGDEGGSGERDQTNDRSPVGGSGGRLDDRDDDGRAGDDSRDDSSDGDDD